MHTDVQLTPTTPASLPSSAPTQLPDNQTLQATTTLTPEDGNVLKKIVSFTVEKIHSENATVKVSRPSYVPEKLNFSAYERFEGESQGISKLKQSYSISCCSDHVVSVLISHSTHTTTSTHTRTHTHAYKYPDNRKESDLNFFFYFLLFIVIVVQMMATVACQ